MPGIVRKLLIFAAVDGLILQPAPPRNHKPATDQAITIAYQTNAIAPLLKDRRDESTAPSALEAHGVIGLLKVASHSFLISISEREQVAQIRGNPVYLISDVALIPLSSQAEAETAITHARETIQRRAKEASAYEDARSDESGDDDVSVTEGGSVVEPGQPRSDGGASPRPEAPRSTSFAEDVIGKKGIYGRFTERWFSRTGWSTEGRKMQGMSSETEAVGYDPEVVVEPATTETIKQESSGSKETPTSPTDAPKTLADPADSTTLSLLPKILRTTKIYFASRNFFFSYDYDLSKPIGKQTSHISNLPLYKAFDPLYFWNKKISEPFIDAGQHNFVLPLLQGFVGQRAFTAEAPEDTPQGSITEAASKPGEVIALQDIRSEITDFTGPNTLQKDFLLTVISRRSVKRAGLRYLRRGIDEDGNVANSVETEQILSSAAWDAPGDKTYSFLQYRGSIPLFFSQSPYSLKPLVDFYGSQATNEAAFKLHFQSLMARYGNVQAASLVDKHGNEAKLGEKFDECSTSLNSAGGIDGKGTNLGFEWFDFHRVCRGMKFENVSQLMETLRPASKSFGWWILQGDTIVKEQTGIVRTNCMDCLDRTNVVQSAFARNTLEAQLIDQGFHIDLENDPGTSWFNTLWADNGDAVSKQYSGTSALKGDFTRTRQRNISGALTDLGLTLTRYYNNIVNDYFTQAVIDYLLGRATENIFAEFEADMKAQDYSVDIRKVRQNAIDTCVKIAVEDPAENLVAGWTLSCPAQPNTLRALPFEECVLLLTERALYFCRFDWSTEKVREFELIDLESIIGIARGAYITSTLAKRDMDEQKNVGLVIRYKTSHHDIHRVNTRSLHTDAEEESASPKSGKGKGEESKILAFKALPPKSSFVSMEGLEQDGLSEVEMVKSACEEIRRFVVAAGKAEVRTAGVEGKHAVVEGETKTAEGDETNAAEGDEAKVVVEERDIISLAEAKRSTGYLEQLGYSLKKLVWA